MRPCQGRDRGFESRRVRSKLTAVGDIVRRWVEAQLPPHLAHTLFRAWPGRVFFFPLGSLTATACASRSIGRGGGFRRSWQFEVAYGSAVLAVQRGKGGESPACASGFSRRYCVVYPAAAGGAGQLRISSTDQRRRARPAAWAGVRERYRGRPAAGSIFWRRLWWGLTKW